MISRLIAGFCFFMGKLPRRNFSQEFLKEVFDYYLQTKSINGLQDKFNVPSMTLYYYLKKYNIDRTIDKIKFSKSIRKYELNEDYFETIDTREKAYILGLFHSDGTINDKSKGSLQIRLKITDINLLEQVNNVFYKDRKLFDNKDNNVNHKKSKILIISSNKMGKDLIKIGITPRKSFNKHFIKLEDNLQFDFIRGYFDGNGSFCASKRNNTETGEVKIISSNNFCLGLIDYLKEHDIYSYWDNDKRSDNRISQFRIRRKKDMIAFFQKMYYDIDGQLYLERKYNKYLQYLKNKYDFNEAVCKIGK